jgi:phytol kinase
MNSLILIVIPPLLLFLMMGVLSRVNSSHVISQELKRKALHISVGLTALSFPLFLNEKWMIVASIGLVVAWLLAVRRLAFLRHHFGSVLHDVRRTSLGDVYFAFAIGGLLLLTQDKPIFFVIPILILTLADAFAAIVGKMFPVGPLAGVAKGKTAAGCIAFFVVAFAVSSWLLLAIADLQTGHALFVAAGLAASTCVAEAISRRGIDNLIVPAVAYLALLISNISDNAGRLAVVQLQLDLNILVAGL